MPVRRYAATYVGLANVPVGNEVASVGVVNTNTGGTPYSSIAEYALPLPPLVEPVKVTPIIDPLYIIDTPEINPLARPKGVIADNSILVNSNTNMNNGLIAPEAFINEEDPYYVPYNTSGGSGVAGTLEATLALGNSAGVYNIDMNGNSIENVNTIYSSVGTDIAIAGDASISMTTLNGEIGLVGKDILIKKTNALFAPFAMARALSAPEEISAFSIPPDTYLDIESEDNIKLTSAGVVDVYGTSVNMYADMDMSGNDINNIAIIRGTSATNPIFAQSPFYISNINSGLANAIGMSVSTVENTATGGAAYGVDIASVGSYAVNGRATGLAIASPFANGANGTARGIFIQDIQGTNTTGIELAGGNTGTTARGIWEHHTNAGVINTFMHNVGIGKDPSGVALDVSGNVKIAGTLDMSGNEIKNMGTIRGTSEITPIEVKSQLQVIDISNSSAFIIGYSAENVVNKTNGGIAYGMDIESVGSTAVNGRAIGLAISSPYANNTGGTAKGVYIADIQGPTTVGIELRGGNNGTTSARGIWEHHSDVNVINTFMHNVGIGKDPSGVALDVSGNGSFSGDAATITLGQNNIYNRVTTAGSLPAGMSFNDTFTTGGSAQTGYHFSTRTNAETSATLTFGRKGNFTNVIGTQGTSANNTVVIASEQSACDFEIRKGVGIAPANLTGGTLLAQVNRTGAVSLPLLGTATTANTLYYNSANGLVTYGAAPGGSASNWATFPATQSVDMSGFDITKVNDITNTAGELNITANDLNLDCTGLTSVLNINSVLGTLIASAGAVSVTAGGTTAINSTGNVTIGSLGTTSIENFNLNNSVLTKVGATADLQLNDIASLNSTTNGSLIDSKATLQVSLTTSTNAGVGFQAENVTSSASDATGLYANVVRSTAALGNAYGAYIFNPTSDNGTSSGIIIQDVTGASSATGVEVAGTMTGGTTRGFWEHSSTVGVKNTFMNPVGIGKDPVNVELDVAGNAYIEHDTASTTDPVLTVATTSGNAVAPYLDLFKDTTTPAVNDGIGVVAFRGRDSAGTKVLYGRIRNNATNVTAGIHTGETSIYAARAGTDTEYLHASGATNEVAINPQKDIPGIGFRIYDSTGVTTNNVLMNADCSAANVMFKNYPQQYVYDIAGSYTLTMPAGFNVMRVLMFGAGGGGGSGRKGAVGTACAGGGGGGGGNGGELWFSRKELFPDASGSMTFYLFVGQGGNGGAAVTADDTNGNNGAAGGQTSINLVNSFFVSMLYYQMSGGNGGSGGTATTGTGGGGASFSGGGNIGSSGRGGGTSTIVGQPDRVLTTPAYCGTIFNSTGGSGAGGGMSAANVAFNGGIFVSPAGQKFNGLGANVNKNGIASAVGDGGNGSTVTFDGILTAANRPFSGGCDMNAGGGASSAVNFSGGAGGEIAAGQPGGRGSGGGGGGAARNGTGTSGKGGKGCDGLVYVTFW